MSLWMSTLEVLPSHPWSLGWLGVVLLASAGRSLRGKRCDVVSPESPHQAVDAELNRLAKGLSHDLNGPLRSVGIALTMVEEDLADGALDEARQTLEVVREQADQLSRMTTALVEYCRTAWRPYPCALVELAPLTRRVLARCMPDDVATVHIDVPETTVRLEQEAFQLVLQSLIDNTRTHREGDTPGSLVVRMQLDHSQPAAQWLTLTVDDDGPGIPPEMHDAVFGIFRRSTTRAVGGGMGLSLAQTLTWRHGGHIELEASPSGGTRVTVRWPLQSEHPS